MVTNVDTCTLISLFVVRSQPFRVVNFYLLFALVNITYNKHQETRQILRTCSDNFKLPSLERFSLFMTDQDEVCDDDKCGPTQPP